MGLRNSSRRVVKSAEDSFVLLNSREIKVKLQERGCKIQVCVQKESKALCKLESGQPAATVDIGGSRYQ